MIRSVPLGQPNGIEAYRQIATALNDVIVQTQPFYVYNVSQPFTVTEDYGVYLVNTVSYGATITASLPPAKAHASKRYVLKNIDGTNPVSIVPNGADTVELLASRALTAAGEKVSLVSDGVSNWAEI